MLALLEGQLGGGPPGAATESDLEQVRDAQRRKSEMKRWIENEQVGGLDYSYWRDNYAYVVDEGGQVVKFKNRRSQDVFDSVVEDSEEQQAGIQMLLPKSSPSGHYYTRLSLFHPQDAFHSEHAIGHGVGAKREVGRD